jgi:hypothetical protein
VHQARQLRRAKALTKNDREFRKYTGKSKYPRRGKAISVLKRLKGYVDHQDKVLAFIGHERKRLKENVGKHNTGTFDDSTGAKNGRATNNTNSAAFSPIRRATASTQEVGDPTYSGRFEGTQQAGTGKARQVRPGGRLLDTAACGGN